MASSLISCPIPGLSFISYLPFTGAQAYFPADYSPYLPRFTNFPAFSTTT